MWLWIALGVFVLVGGLVYGAYRDSRKLEKGLLEDVLKKRRLEEEEYKRRTGEALKRPDPYADDEDR